MNETLHIDLQALRPYLKVETFSTKPTDPILTQGEEIISVGMETLARQFDLDVPAHELAEMLAEALLGYITDADDTLKERVEVIVSEAVTNARSTRSHLLQAQSGN